jgi:hypothetical protein
MLSSVMIGVQEFSGFLLEEKIPPSPTEGIEMPQPLNKAAKHPKLSSLEAAGKKLLICPFIFYHQDFDTLRCRRDFE